MFFPGESLVVLRNKPIFGLTLFRDFRDKPHTGCQCFQLEVRAQVSNRVVPAWFTFHFFHAHLGRRKWALGFNRVADTFRITNNIVVDPLVQPGTLSKTVGYVGRRYGKTYNGSDVYLDTDATLRSRYQLEPGVTVKDKDKVENFYDYIDFKNTFKRLTKLKSLYLQNNKLCYESEFIYNKMIFFLFLWFINLLITYVFIRIIRFILLIRINLKIFIIFIRVHDIIIIYLLLLSIILLFI